jgi:RecJ-like exonuclease
MNTSDFSTRDHRAEGVAVSQPSGCRCVRCGECGGTGRVEVDEEFWGDSDTCYECDGTGLVEVCDFCREREEAREDATR